MKSYRVVHLKHRSSTQAPIVQMLNVIHAIACGTTRPLASAFESDSDGFAACYRGAAPSGGARCCALAGVAGSLGEGGRVDDDWTLTVGVPAAEAKIQQRTQSVENRACHEQLRARAVQDTRAIRTLRDAQLLRRDEAQGPNDERDSAELN